MQDLIAKLSKLNEASRAMTRCRELGPLLDTILRLVEELFQLDTCAILLLNEESGALKIERARGYDPEVIETLVPLCRASFRASSITSGSALSVSFFMAKAP